MASHTQLFSAQWGSDIGGGGFWSKHAVSGCLNAQAELVPSLRLNQARYSHDDKEI